MAGHDHGTTVGLNLSVDSNASLTGLSGLEALNAVGIDLTVRAKAS